MVMDGPFVAGLPVTLTGLSGGPLAGAGPGQHRAMRGRSNAEDGQPGAILFRDAKPGVPPGGGK
jgi:hypothetical protein